MVVAPAFSCRATMHIVSGPHDLQHQQEGIASFDLLAVVLSTRSYP